MWVQVRQYIIHLSWFIHSLILSTAFRDKLFSSLSLQLFEGNRFCPFKRFCYVCGIFYFLIFFAFHFISMTICKVKIWICRLTKKCLLYFLVSKFFFLLGLSVFIFCSKDVISIFTPNQYRLFHLILHSVTCVANVLLDGTILTNQILLD